MRMLMMAVYDMSLPVSAFVAVIIDFPDDILWVLLVQRVIRINAGMNENAVLIDVHQWQSLDPLQMLVGYDRHIGLVAFILPIRLPLRGDKNAVNSLECDQFSMFLAVLMEADWY